MDHIYCVANLVVFYIHCIWMFEYLIIDAQDKVALTGRNLNSTQYYYYQAYKQS